MNRDYDVVIVGAGPAGATCALALHNSGLKVALVDKSEFPRNKTCGDAIPGPSLKILNKFIKNPEEKLKELGIGQRIKSCSIYTAKNRCVQINWKTQAYNSPRISFDNFLLNLVKEHTRTEVYEGIAINEVSKNGKIKLKVKNSNLLLNCDLVVGCDGAYSIVSRAFDVNPFDNSSNCIAIRAYYENVGSPEDSNEFYLLNDIPGYFWIFPLGKNIYNVGLGLMKNNIAGNKLDIKKILKSNIEINPVLNKKFRDAEMKSNIEGFMLPMGGQKIKRSGERFILTGDAAYLIDPLQGHGIDKAMHSGLLAARQIQKCFQYNDFSSQFISEYDSIIDKAIGRELKRNLLLMKILYKQPWLIEFLSMLTNNKYIRYILYKLFYLKSPHIT